MSNVQYMIRTQYGKFVVKFAVLRDRNTEEIASYTVSIGSKDKKCVQIKVPAKEENGYLMWVEADEDCTLERYIQKGLAQHMTLLGLTIARKLNPRIKTISFEDTSSFLCKLPNNTEIRVPMKAFHIAFHEATWYEYYFDARLKRKHGEYLRLKRNMYKTENKPPRFDFIHPDLQRELEPLYEATTNWYDFFQEISRVYGKKKCAVVYPWLIRAMNEIFESNIYDDTQWYIDFEENKAADKTPMLELRMSDLKKVEGGKRTTTKRRRYTFSRTHMFPNIPKMESWDYRKFLRG